MTTSQTITPAQRLEHLALPEDKFELTNPLAEAAARIERDATQERAECALQEQNASFSAAAGEKLGRVIPHLEAIVDKLALGNEGDFSGKTETMLDHVRYGDTRYYPQSLTKERLTQLVTLGYGVYSKCTITFLANTLVAEYTMHRGHYFSDDITTLARVTIGGQNGESTLHYLPTISPVGRAGCRIGLLAASTLGAIAGILLGGAATAELAVLPIFFGGLIGIPSACGLASDYFSRKRGEVPLKRMLEVVPDADDVYSLLKFFYALPAAIEAAYASSKSRAAKQQKATIKQLEDEGKRIALHEEGVQRLSI